MNPSRNVGLPTSNTLKRRVRGFQKKNTDHEPAITLLPLELDNYDFPWDVSPRVYRATAPKSAKNREASSFVILGETYKSPVQSRPGSPSGRISPFRGHGFKSPKSSRPNSRATTPGASPKKRQNRLASGKSDKKSTIYDREPFNIYAGLPPKSPMRNVKSQLTNNDASHTSKALPKKSDNDMTSENSENQTVGNLMKNNEEEEKKEVENITIAHDLEEKNEVNKTEDNSEVIGEIENNGENYEENKGIQKIIENSLNNENEKIIIIDNNEKIKKSQGKTIMKNNVGGKKSAGDRRKTPEMAKKHGDVSPQKDKIMPIEYYKDAQIRKLSPVSPRPKSKSKTEKNDSNLHEKKIQNVKKFEKPPIPPRKTGLKPILKSNDNKSMTSKRSKNTFSSGKEKLNERIKKNNEGNDSNHLQEKTEEISVADNAGKEMKSKPSVESPLKIIIPDKNIKEEKKNNNEENTRKEENKDDEGKNEKLVPCYQPDKCNIAPPTMASPSPIITPSISTPSTSADLALSSTQNSQSISTAPTTVTSSGMKSVSSTVVLNEDLSRKENEITQVETDSDISLIKKKPPSASSVISLKKDNLIKDADKNSVNMVKAGTKILVKEKSSGEITSGTKVIKAEPDMEVLSPNNLRNSPGRMEAMNLPGAWDEER